MTKEEFRELTKSILLLDGATGSNLIAEGMPRGVCIEQWVLSHKEVIQNLQSSYIREGSRVIYAPTFGGNRINLGRYGLEDQIEDINRTLVGYSREIAPVGVFVAGDLTTTGLMMEPAGPLTYDQAFETYREQARILFEAGVDLIVVETMINIEETISAVDAIHFVCDLPVMCSMTVEADGSIFTGGNAAEAAAALETSGADAVGVNCSVGPDQLLAVIRSIRESVAVPVLAKPNAGMPTIEEDGTAVYSMQPEAFALHMQNLVEAGASVIGGCCGTTPAYIRAIAQRLGLSGKERASE